VKTRILVVEDEPSVADTVTFALGTEGFDAAWASTGEEALKLLAAQPAALVILDVGLPDCSGFDLCRTIRERGPLPVIFLTSRSEEVDRIVGLEIGADDYVVKPFSPRELCARVRAVLRRASPLPDPPEVQVRGTKIPLSEDPQRGVITFRGRALDLTAHEYRILAILLKHPGWVYSRQQLMDLCWEEPTAGLERTVDSHIKNLRLKLKAVDPGLDPIVTHHGRGYSLREGR
jgi:two-component system, OmpR family, catabolic regulation response regulator CreB